jgi:nitrogen-specific signal transduction histidine kinase
MSPINTTFHTDQSAGGRLNRLGLPWTRNNRLVADCRHLAEENLGKLFDAFFTTKGPEQGSGIGLFMSKTIIEKSMGGRLTVRNIGSGAEFRIEV